MALAIETQKKIMKLYKQLTDPNYSDEPLIRNSEDTIYKKTITKSMPAETQLLYRQFNSNNRSRIDNNREPITLEEYLNRKANNQYVGKDAADGVVGEHNFNVMNNNRKKRGLTELTWKEYLYRKVNNIILN